MLTGGRDIFVAFTRGLASGDVVLFGVDGETFVASTWGAGCDDAETISDCEGELAAGLGSGNAPFSDCAATAVVFAVGVGPDKAPPIVEESGLLDASSTGTDSDEVDRLPDAGDLLEASATGAGSDGAEPNPD